MATDTRTVTFTAPNANGTLTSLKPISDGLQAMVTAGKLTQTGDSGQVSWGSVTATTVSTTYYEIFYLNDSLHSTFPLYFKFTYRANATTVRPSCSIQIGTATDGSGNLAGIVSASVIYRGLADVADAVAEQIWTSCGSGYLNMWGGFNATSNLASSGGYALSIERLRDGSGAITGDGINVVMTTNQMNSTLVVYPAGQGGASNSVFLAANIPMIAAGFGAQRYMLPNLFNLGNIVWPPVMNRGNGYYGSTMYDGASFLSCAIQPDAGKIYSPGIGCLLLDTNFPSLNTIIVTSYSTSHTYLTTSMSCPAIIMSTAPQAIGAGTINSAVPSPMLPAFLYE